MAKPRVPIPAPVQPPRRPAHAPKVVNPAPWAPGAAPSATATPSTAPSAPPASPTSTPPQLLLYDVEASPFCAKVRAALRYQRLSFERHDAMQVQHWFTLRKTSLGKVPVMVIDGQTVFDSTDICEALHQRWPQRPLLPPGERERALCRLLEDWCDEALYFPVLHYTWADPANAAAVRARFPAGLMGGFIYRGYRRLIHKQLQGQGTGRKSPAHIEDDLRRQLGALQALLEGKPFLVGLRPWLCDWALDAQLAALAAAPGSATVLNQFKGLLDYRGRLAVWQD